MLRFRVGDHTIELAGLTGGQAETVLYDGAEIAKDGSIGARVLGNPLTFSVTEGSEQVRYEVDYNRGSGQYWDRGLGLTVKRNGAIVLEIG